MVRTSALVWKERVREALREGPGTVTEIKKRLGKGTDRTQVYRAIDNLKDENAVRQEIVDGRLRYVLRTVEASLEEFEKGKETIQGERCVIRLSAELKKLLKDDFKGNWDSVAWLSGLRGEFSGVKGEPTQGMSEAERVGYHLHEAAGALQGLIWNRTEKRIVDGLEQMERELFREYVDSVRTRGGPAIGKREKAGEKVADRVQAETIWGAQDLGEKGAVLEVFGDSLRDLLFYDEIRRRTQKMPVSEFKEFAKDFFHLFDDPHFSLSAPGGAWPGQLQFIELLERQGFNTGDILRINEWALNEKENAWMKTAGTILRQIGARKGDLPPSLKHSFTVAQRFEEFYIRTLKEWRGSA